MKSQHKALPRSIQHMANCDLWGSKDFFRSIEILATADVTIGHVLHASRQSAEFSG